MSVAGVKFTTVQFKGGGPAAQSIIAGDTDVMFATPPTVMGYIRAGRMRALAITARNASPAIPGIPGAAEAGLAGYDHTFSFGLWVAMPSTPAYAQGVVAEKALLGEWEGHVVEGDGSNAAQRRMNITLTITDKKISASGGQGQPMGEGTYKVSGKHIDATGTSGKYQGHTYLGLLSQEGDTLKWCSGNEGAKGRPAALRTNPKYGHFLMVLTRKK